MYVGRREGQVVIRIVIYVDDGFVGSYDRALSRKLKDAMRERFGVESFHDWTAQD